jgi:hypothetical protein
MKDYTWLRLSIDSYITNRLYYRFYIDILLNKVKWRGRHQTPSLAFKVTNKNNETISTLEQLPGPIPLVDSASIISMKNMKQMDDASANLWEESGDESVCFDYGELIGASTIDNNLGIDVDIFNNLMVNSPMRDIISTILEFGLKHIKFFDIESMIETYRSRDHNRFILSRLPICLDSYKT